MDIKAYSLAVDILPVVVLVAGVVIFRARAIRGHRRPWLFSALWGIACVAYFVNPSTNIMTSLCLDGVEKWMIMSRLMGANEDAVRQVLGPPKSRLEASGSRAVQLVYPTSPWWGYWKDGLLINIEGGRVKDSCDFE